MFNLNRHWASLVYPAILVVMGLIYFRHEWLYHEILYFWGASRKGVVFSDLNSVLTQVWCYGEGFDPYTVHAERPECRGFAYSPFLLELAFILPGPEHRYLIGVVNLLTFAVLIQFLPLERRRSDYALVGLALMSAPVIWLLETSNLDLLFLEAALVASILFCRGPGARLLGYALLLFAASLKFYPIVLMGQIARERLGVVVLTAVLVSLAVVAFVLIFFSGVTTTISNLPRASYFQYCWGAVVLPLGAYYLATGVDLLADESSALKPHPFYVPHLAMAVLIFWALVRAFAYSRMKAVSDAYQALGDLHRSLMVSGCLIIIGCFLAWANLPYRQAFLLLALPGLLAMKDAATGEPLRLTRCTAVLLIALMWWDTIRVALTEGMAAIDTPEPLSLAVRIGFWLMGQLIWWHAIAVLGAVLLTFLKTSRAMSELRAVITRFFRPHADRT